MASVAATVVVRACRALTRTFGQRAGLCCNAMPMGHQHSSNRVVPCMSIIRPLKRHITFNELLLQFAHMELHSNTTACWVCKGSLEPISLPAHCADPVNVNNCMIVIWMHAYICSVN